MSSEGFLWQLLIVATERHELEKDAMNSKKMQFLCMIKQEKDFLAFHS